MWPHGHKTFEHEFVLVFETLYQINTWFWLDNFCARVHFLYKNLTWKFYDRNVRFIDYEHLFHINSNWNILFYNSILMNLIHFSCHEWFVERLTRQTSFKRLKHFSTTQRQKPQTQRQKPQHKNRNNSTTQRQKPQ